MDVLLHLEPLVQEMEIIRETVMIIGNKGILHIIYAYFTSLSWGNALFVSILLKYVIRLNPRSYSTKEVHTCLLSKEDMLVDGQDKPMTSMPMTEKVWMLRVNATSSEQYKFYGGRDVISVEDNDPVMNPYSH